MQPIQPNPGGFQYHIMGVDGREYGPVAVDGLQQWLAQGQMTAQTQVHRSHEPQWQPAMSMPELQSLLGTVGGPPVVGAVMSQALVDPAKAATAKKNWCSARTSLATGDLWYCLEDPSLAE